MEEKGEKEEGGEKGEGRYGGIGKGRILKDSHETKSSKTCTSVIIKSNEEWHD